MIGDSEISKVATPLLSAERASLQPSAIMPGYQYRITVVDGTGTVDIVVAA